MLIPLQNDQASYDVIKLRDTVGYSRIFSRQWELSGLFTV